MLNKEDIEKIDSCGMYKIYDIWPDLAIEAFEKEYLQIESNQISHIVFAGMGGSGALGDIFNAIFSKTNVHISVVKGYLLPKTVDKNTLVISTSISGNTAETLNVLKKSVEIGCKNLAISSGGKMETFCSKNSVNYNKIKMVHSPRSSFTTFLYSMLKILEPILPIKKNEIDYSIKMMKVLQQKISSTNLKSSNPSLSLAEWISGIPLIYYPHGLQAAAIRFKNSLQENAKNHAIIEDVIESSHNGIVAWEKASIVKPILIKGDEDFFKTKERWQILKEYFIENSIEYKEIFSIRGDILTKLINLIYLFDYASIYKAIYAKIDPTPITSIDFVKKRLKG